MAKRTVDEDTRKQPVAHLCGALLLGLYYCTCYSAVLIFMVLFVCHAGMCRRQMCLWTNLRADVEHGLAQTSFA